MCFSELLWTAITCFFVKALAEVLRRNILLEVLLSIRLGNGSFFTTQVDLFDSMLQDDDSDEPADVEEAAVHANIADNASQSPLKRSRCATDVFPFAQGEQYYNRLFTSLGKPESATNCVIASTTSHPSSWLAAARLQLQVFCFPWCHFH